VLKAGVARIRDRVGGPAPQRGSRQGRGIDARSDRSVGAPFRRASPAGAVLLLLHGFPELAYNWRLCRAWRLLAIT
jgi:pimeloyl-ACP methyl ester carboxylesterase